MSQSNDFKSDETTIVIENLLNIAKDFDRIMLEAVEAGMESGRSIGVIESYNFLVREGYTNAAEALMELVKEEEEVRLKQAHA